MVPGLLIVCAALLLAGMPAVGLMMAPGAHGMDTGLHHAGDLVVPTLAWGLAVAGGSVLLGQCTVRAFAAGPLRRLVYVIVPLLMPASAVFYAWFAALPAPLSPGWTKLLLWAALVSTHWPIATVCLLPGQREVVQSRDDMLRQLGASWRHRVVMTARTHWPAWAAAVGLVWATSLSATTAFDLGGVVTAATEVRSRLALGASGPAVIGPLVVVLVPCVCGLLGGWWVVRQWRQHGLSDSTAEEQGGSGVPLMVVCLATTILPLVLLTDVVPSEARRDGGLVQAVIDATGRSCLVALCTMLLVVPVVALTRSVRGAWWPLVSACWFVAALLPCAFVAAGWAQWQLLLPEWFAAAGGGRFLALLLPASGAALLLGHVAAWAMPQDRLDLRQGAGVPWWRPCRFTMTAMIGAGALGLAWSGFAPAIERMLAPPADGPPMVTRLVDAMHYQRPETVTFALWVLAMLAAGLAMLVSVLTRRINVLLVCLVLVACDTVPPTPVDAGPTGVPAEAIIGGPGTSSGRFRTPRAAAVHGGVLWVIDRSGRLQRFRNATGSGEVDTWMLPLDGRGYPTGIELDAAGTIWIADTHGSRILRGTRGDALTPFAGVGAPGTPELPTPSDVCVLPDGRVAVSVYGGDDAVHLLDEKGRHLHAIGPEVAGAGRLARPQSLVVDRGGKLWIADACNHRLLQVDPDTGGLLQVLDADGAMRYPYGLAVLPDGDLLVAEFGGNVLRRISPAGDRTRVWGGWGDAPGQLRTPWSVEIDEDAGVVYLLDAGHDRVLHMPVEALAW